MEWPWPWWAWVCVAVGVIILAIVAIALVVVQRVPKLKFKGRRVLITGGSAGIGLSVAKEIARRGGHVAIAARRQEVLDAAAAEIEKEVKGAKVATVAVDVSDAKKVSTALKKVTKTLGGNIEILICSAGFSHPSRFLDMPVDVERGMMDVNYFGTTHVVRAVLPDMIEAGYGRVVCVSSMAAAAAIAGFSGYSPTKAALRAFAQAMDMEHAPLGIRFQVVNPPDVSTPGYEAENKVKSEECKRICAMGGASPFTSQSMAQAVIDGVETYSFQINLGMDGWLLGAGSAGMEPPTSFLQLIAEFSIAGILRLVSTIYTKLHYGIVFDVRKKEKDGLAAQRR